MKKKKIEEQTAKKELVKRNEKQIKFAIIIMAVLIATFLLSYFGVRYLLENMNKFSYSGINFQKDSFGYWGNFPVNDIYGNKVDDVKVRFWEDPRKIERIDSTRIALTKVTAVDLETLFSQGNCLDGTQAGQTLLLYLNHPSLFGITPLQVTTNKTISEIYNITYVDCNEPSQISIVVLKKGDESSIKKEGSCYVLEAGNNCEIMNVTERFMIRAFVDAH